VRLISARVGAWTPSQIASAANEAKAAEIPSRPLRHSMLKSCSFRTVYLSFATRARINKISELNGAESVA
jgi:hypothetical protein